MDRTQALKKLKAWDGDESFYRDFYLAAQAGSGTDALLSREEVPEDVKQTPPIRKASIPSRPRRCSLPAAVMLC